MHINPSNIFTQVFIIAILEIALVIIVVAITVLRTKKQSSIAETKKPARARIKYKKSIITKKQIGNEVRKIQVILFAVGIIAFTLAYISLTGTKISDMGTDEFFIENITPLGYWIGIMVLMTITTITGNRFSKKKSSLFLFIILSALLMVSVRMVFAEIFTNQMAYEPDVTMYANIVRSWSTTGIDFGIEGNYQHDFPLSFLIAYVFVKLGVPLDVFFRWMPVLISLVDFSLIYLILNKIYPHDKRYAATAVFIFAFSSMNYWIPTHYSPQSIGTIFYFLSLYLTVSFLKKGTWNFKTMAPVFLSVFFLILSHHLSILYFVFTLMGLSISARFFSKESYQNFKGKEFVPFIVGVFTYSLWFIYGNSVYPSFFSFQKYLSFQPSTAQDISTSTIFDQITALIFPLFVSGLFLYNVTKALEIRKPSDIFNIFTKLKNAQTRLGPFLVYSCGFVILAIVFVFGTALAAIEPFRILEVILVGMLPISSQGFINLRGKPSRKKEILLILVLNLMLITSVHRYYRRIQRRIINW